MPDLVVSSIRITGDPVINSKGAVELPLAVTVKNQGTGIAGNCKVSVDYTRAGGTFVVAYTVPGQSDIWYPYTGTSLGAGATKPFVGKLTFHPSVHGETVTITALADSCSGDEMMPSYCRVNESDESNNESATVSAALP